MHSCKESCLDVFLEAAEEASFEPTAEAETRAMYALSEICLNVEYDLETGESKILGVVDDES